MARLWAQVEMKEGLRLGLQLRYLGLTTGPFRIRLHSEALARQAGLGRVESEENLMFTGLVLVGRIQGRYMKKLFASRFLNSPREFFGGTEIFRGEVRYRGQCAG